jgi:hypothetical protein
VGNVLLQLVKDFLLKGGPTVDLHVLQHCNGVLKPVSPSGLPQQLDSCFVDTAGVSPWAAVRRGHSAAISIFSASSIVCCTWLFVAGCNLSMLANFAAISDRMTCSAEVASERVTCSAEVASAACTCDV